MTDVKRPEGVEGHKWASTPQNLDAKRQTALTFYALGALQPEEISQATSHDNTYSIAQQDAEITKLAQESFPRIPPKFLK